MRRMDDTDRGKFDDSLNQAQKSARTWTQGIFRTWPGRIKSLLRLLADFNLATVVFFLRAMP